MTPTPPVDPHALRALATSAIEAEMVATMARRTRRESGNRIKIVAAEDRAWFALEALADEANPAAILSLLDTLDTSQREVSRLSAALDGFVGFIGSGENSRGAFPTNLSELNADAQEFASLLPSDADLSTGETRP